MTALAKVTRVADRHWFIAPLSIALAAAVTAGVAYDRRDPLTFVEASISPDPAVAGREAILRWHTEWSRACEAVVSRELIGSDRIVRAYVAYRLRIPTRVGLQTADIEFRIPPAIPQGETVYRAVMRFSSCGITSRFAPLVVETPEVRFNVKRP